MNWIPTHVPLLGHVIPVRVVRKADWKYDEDTMGIWDPRSNVIDLNDEFTGTQLEQCYFHELTHAMLDMLDHKLARNEQFVEQLSGLLHQAITGATYPPAVRRKKVKS